MNEVRIGLSLIVFVMILAVACMSGSGIPEEDEAPCCPGEGDDEDGVGDDDQADDDEPADDDDAVEDDDSSVDDDDAGQDDDDIPPVECSALVDLIYDTCTAEISDGLGARLSKDEALNECEDQYSFFECAESCRIADPECDAFTACVEQCAGGYHLI